MTNTGCLGLPVMRYLGGQGWYSQVGGCRWPSARSLRAL